LARLLLGVSGGIAAYKALELARLAIGAGHSVRVIQTPTALRFVGSDSFAAITGAPVLVSEFDPDPARGAYPGEASPEHQPISHLALVERADAYLIAPASANTIAKLAHGLADNLLSTAALAAPCPLALAPAMNNRMWLASVTQANVELLRARGVTVLEPASGSLASRGEEGVGRLPEPPQLLEAVEALLALPTLAGMRVLVSAGGTREPIDQVRYIGNRSSGRMGYELARVAARRGAQVTVIAANVALPPPAGVEVVRVQSAAELARACRRRFDDCDVLLMAAAVGDFRPAQTAAGKLKKNGPQAPSTLVLEPTEDVLRELASLRRPGQLLVGFAAEHGPGALDYGREKLTRKGLDAIVVNDVSRPEIGFDSPENEVTIVLASGETRQIARRAKERVAEAVLDAVESLRRAGGVPAIHSEGTEGHGAERADVSPARR
jgi:phosphopantothenoylcysteine decarboxylase/phosphopantothenate--cysteine ligase